MSKPLATSAKAKPSVGVTPPSSKRASPPSYANTTREIVEQVIIALVLAFLFRTFEAEAFVIPTGSMAPTLQGRHKEVTCPECGYTYRVGASNEVEDESQPDLYQRLSPAEQQQRRRAAEVVASTCPMCRYTVRFDSEGPQGDQFPSYGGDRILVGKFPYEFAAPRRWDVIVFKYPGDAKINFIKRLVGLPGEILQIRHGDIFTQRGEGDFEIERKPPMKLRAMAQIVYDNDYVADAMTQKGWPVRWQPWGIGGHSSDQDSGVYHELPGQWKSPDGSRSYETDGAAPGEAWIRYRHFVPTAQDWLTMDGGGFSASAPPKPQLITDFYAYNGGIQRTNRGMVTQGLHWVGDLLVESQLEIRSADGSVLLDLVKGGKHFRCALDVATGKATLSIDDLEDFHPSAQTTVVGKGSHKVMFSNVDRELRLWVDDSVVTFDAPTTYPPLKNEDPRSTAADPGDLAPVGIGARGAALRASHIRVLRDIYYIADKEDGTQTGGGIWDYRPNNAVPIRDAESLAEFMSNPRAWKPHTAGQLSPFQQRQTVEFPLAEGQYFALGDNSPYSKDSRLWSPEEQFVDQRLLIGKALFIYWPASHSRITGTDIPFPMFPNFPAMGLVR